MAEVKNAVQDGARLLDEVEGAGTAEVWTNLCLSQGGEVLATPALFLLGYPSPEDSSTLYVAYAYGDVRSLAGAARFLHGRYKRISFRRGFGVELDEVQAPHVYDYDELMHRLERMAARYERN